MRPGGGAPKGSAFERHVGLRLSLWLTGGARADLFSRNVLSGGRFTRAVKAGSELAIPGDLVAAHPLAIEFIKAFSVECKHHREIKLDVYLFDGRERSKLAKIVKLATDQAAMIQAVPMIVVKQNHRDAAVLLPYKVGMAALHTVRHKEAFVYHLLHNQTVFMTPLECFVSLVNPMRFMDKMTAICA